MSLIKNIRRLLKGRATYNSISALSEHLQRDIGVQIENTRVSSGERTSYVRIDLQEGATPEQDESEKDWFSRDGPLGDVGWVERSDTHHLVL